MFPAAIGWLAHHTVSGIFGAVIARGVMKAAPRAKPVARKAAVNSVAGGIVAGRWLASAAEEARLKAGDVVSEAQAQLGEDSSGPGTPAASPGQGSGDTKAKSGAMRARRRMDHGH
ncbi:DUF1490 family protein [Streptomyces sp. NPDC055036]